NSPAEFLDFRNNVIYNWGDNSIYGGEKGKYNLVNNYFKSGPATSESKKNRIVNPSSPFGKFYVNGNFVNDFPEISQNNWNGGVQCDSLDVVRMDTEISIENNIKTQSADEAYVSVLKSAGASFFRDSVDERIINDVRSGTTSVGNGIIDSQEDVGGWPQLQSKETPKDTDGDGMPDVWEKAAALDINKDDSALYSLSKVYTNIEVYINSL